VWLSLRRAGGVSERRIEWCTQEVDRMAKAVKGWKVARCGARSPCRTRPVGAAVGSFEEVEDEMKRQW
jgi:hypothetical protein